MASRKSKYSKKGWYVRTALAAARDFWEVFDEGTPTERVTRASPEEAIRAIHERMTSFKQRLPGPSEGAHSHELRWTFFQRDAHGNVIGSSISFLAPHQLEVRRLRAEQVERNARERHAQAEAAHIRRALAPGRRRSSAATPEAATTRRL